MAFWSSPWAWAGAAVVGLYAVTRPKKKTKKKKKKSLTVTLLPIHFWDTKWKPPTGPAPLSPEWFESMAVKQPGLPLLPGEMKDYARSVAWYSSLSSVAYGVPKLNALVTSEKAALKGLNGGQLHQRRREGEATFKKLCVKINERLVIRRSLLPKNAGPAGSGASIVWWDCYAPIHNWIWTQTDWYGRHYAGGSMWDNLKAGPAIVSDGIQTSAGIIWKGIKAAGPYLELAASFIPVYGPWIVAAIHYAYTGDLEESLKAAVRAAIPGGPIAQMGVDFALATIEGEPPPQAALDAFFKQYPEAKLAYDATMEAKDAIKSGDIQKAVDKSTEAYAQAQQTKTHMQSDFS